MEKKICAYIFAATFITLTTVVHGQPSTIHREPSVDPIVEVDIEDAKVKEGQPGYDFAATERMPATTSHKSRVPANIVSKTQETTPVSMVGPLIFLIALPIGLWIMVSKKFSKKSEEKSVGYFPKTHQFTPFKTDYQKSSDDEDDMDFPKAS